MLKMNEELAIKTLKQVKTVFDDHKIIYWVDMGTLLGALRNGRFIPSDDDIDLGVWVKDFGKVSNASLELKKEGFEIFFSENHIGIFKHEKGDKILLSISAYDIKDNDAVLIWYFHPKSRYKDGLIVKKRNMYILIVNCLKYFLWLNSYPEYLGDHPRFISNELQIILVNIFKNFNSHRKILLLFFKGLGCKYLYIKIPINFFKNFKKIYFYGMSFNIPFNAIEYIRYKYGNNWLIPRSDWIYYKDDGAINEK